MQPQRLDIFDHSRDTMLRNDVAAALERHDPTGTRSAWRTLAGEFPGDDTLAPLSVLVDALERRTTVPFPDHESVHHARRALSEVIEPAAVRIFGERADAGWTGPLWGEMAQRAAHLPFRPEHGDEHCAALWLRAGEGAAASDAVARIASWRRIPAPLAWMTEAHYRVHDLEGAWPLLAKLVALARTIRLADQEGRRAVLTSAVGPVRALSRRSVGAPG